MSESDNVNNNLNAEEKKFEDQMQLKKIREEVLKKYEDYRKTISFLATDAPIGILCLSKAIENILIDHGYLRVYDLFDMDFTKIKGLGVIRSRNLAASLDQFFSGL
jgi:hypothetical protein